jgi:sugar/nucleoside kinase (ribokinase family)
MVRRAPPDTRVGADPDRPAELLVVGGLTVDRFADGSSAPGGSVLHSSLAAAMEGAAVAMLTVCGDEPAAASGVGRLGRLGRVVRQPAAASCTYRHDESGGHRTLVYEAETDPITLETAALAPPASAVLLAPIASELPPVVLGALRKAARSRLAVMLIQGWLRDLEVGHVVHALPLDEVPDALWSELAVSDAVVLSTEDLADAPGDPFAQAREVRSRIGPRPVLALTLGVEGYILDDPAEDHVVASVPRRVITDVPTVGAGDFFGAAFAIHLSRGADPTDAARAGAERVISMLEGRRAAC